MDYSQGYGGGYGYTSYGCASAIPVQHNNNNQLVLYNTAGSLAAFAPVPASSTVHNPFCPGLKPLPLTPPPKTFVEAGGCSIHTNAASSGATHAFNA